MTRWVRAGALVGAPDLVAELGGDFSLLAAHAGLSPDLLDTPDAPIEAAAVPRFLDLASDALACPGFGLRLGARQDFGLLGEAGLPIRNAPTVGALVRTLMLLFPRHTEGAIVGLAAEGEDTLVTYELSADVYSSHRQVVELGFSVLVGEIRKHRPDWYPSYVAFRHAPPEEVRWHQRLLGPNLVFNADRNAVLLDAALLAQPRRPDGPEPRTSLKPETQAPADFLRFHTERLVRASLPSRLLRVEQAASLLGMSTRTLQRRLASAQCSFEAIVDAVRADLALAYLKDSRLSVTQIAEALQFSETSALSRAVRRWHDRSPRELRRDLCRGFRRER